MVLPESPFYPYILLVIWTVFFTIPFTISLSLLQMREQSFAFGLLCVLQFIINHFAHYFFCSWIPGRGNRKSERPVYELQLFFLL